MPVHYDPAQFQNLKTRIASIFGDIKPDLELVGKLAAEAIVRTTLAGIGEGDQPFKAYSAAYQATIDAVGGKPRQVVDLRGLFYHAGQRRVKFRSEARRRQFRADRQAYVSVSFTLSRRGRRAGRAERRAGRMSLAALLAEATGVPRRAGIPKAIAAFTGKTGVTRPARGVTDALSEMSLDLIKVRVEDNRVRIVYTARKTGYMIRHNTGDAKMPQRKWFTLDKAAVKAAVIRGLELIIKARVLRAELTGGTPRTGPVAGDVEGVVRQALNLPGA